MSKGGARNRGKKEPGSRDRSAKGARATHDGARNDGASTARSSRAHALGGPTDPAVARKAGRPRSADSTASGPSGAPRDETPIESPGREAKRRLRAEIRRVLRAASPRRLAWKSRAVSDFIVRAPPLAGRGLLLAYRALSDEACVDAAVAQLSLRGWRIAFPAIDRRGAMQLVELVAASGAGGPFEDARWTLDRHGIRAPRLDRLTARRVRPRELDAVLVPARAFDRAGNRLGRGQGHYDRLLAGLRPDARANSIGVAFEDQLVEAVPVDSHDRPVAWVATNRGIIRCRRA